MLIKLPNFRSHYVHLSLQICPRLKPCSLRMNESYELNLKNVKNAFLPIGDCVTIINIIMKIKMTKHSAYESKLVISKHLFYLIIRLFGTLCRNHQIVLFYLTLYTICIQFSERGQCVKMIGDRTWLSGWQKKQGYGKLALPG